MILKNIAEYKLRKKKQSRTTEEESKKRIIFFTNMKQTYWTVQPEHGSEFRKKDTRDLKTGSTLKVCVELHAQIPYVSVMTSCQC